MEGPTCPHCGHVITPDDGSYYDERNYTEDEGGKRFAVSVCLMASWTTKALVNESQ